MNIFDIIGPVMIGPSSSHTAGALRIGNTARLILGETVQNAEIGFCGSFAHTYKGHGSDKAIVAGLLGLLPDDERIRNSFSLAKDHGLHYTIRTIHLPNAHPNTITLYLTGVNKRECSVTGASVGGGSIVILSVNGMKTEFSGQADTLIIPHKDMPGVIAEVTSLMAQYGVNIGNFQLSRIRKGFRSVMVVEVDRLTSEEIIEKLRTLPLVDDVIYLSALQNKETKNEI